MTTHEILVAARNLLEREGWVGGPDVSVVWGPQGYSSKPSCAGNHIASAEHGELNGPANMVAVDALLVAAEVPLSLRRYSVMQALWEWNDAPGRTKEEVLAAFDKAIAATAPEPDTSFLSEPTRDPVPA